MFRACSGREQSARFARAAPEPPRRAPGFAHNTEPRHALSLSPQHAKKPWCPAAPPSETLAARRHPQRVSARSVPPKPLQLTTCPWNSSASSSRVSSSSRRRHDALTLQGGGSPESLSTAATEPTSSRYKWTPRATLSTHATSDHPYGTPLARIRPGEASFLISGNSCRRHHPGQSGTSSTSPSPFASPGTSSSSRETVPLLNFDREPPQPQNHFAPETISTAKLVAGNSVHVGDHSGYPRVRLDLLSTPMHSDH